MKNKIVSLFIACLSLCSAAITPDAPYIYVVGNSTLSVKADTAYLTFRIIERNEDLSAAIDAVKSTSNKIFSMLAEEHIGQGRIVAHKMDVYQEAEGAKNQKISAFRVSREFRIIMNDLQRYGIIIEKIAKLSVSEVSAANFSYSKSNEVRAKCEELAIDDARRHADRIAAKTGVKIKQVYAISPVPFGDIEDRIYPREPRDSGDGFSQPLAPEPPPTKQDFVIPDMQIEASLHVIFTLIVN